MGITLCTSVITEKGDEINSFKAISGRYFRSKFVFEILPIYPYWVALFFATNDVQTNCVVDTSSKELGWECIRKIRSVDVYMWWALSGVRVAPRFYRLLRDFRALESNLELAVRALQVIKFAMMIFLTTHWVGCISYFIALQYDLDWRTWVLEMEYLLPLYDRFSTPTWNTYLLCLYKGLNELTDLGYVLVYPNNMGEMIFSVFVMIASVWLEGNILGTLLNYMVDKDPVAEAHKKEMEDLHRFIEYKNLAPELASR
eukprot:CAMPEP_0113684502 /NCGR_PEP_ID=MMETSP0038_2-20120614/14045_1 /TAXON_ID=2898 /ORGANISM="Cryptomonas paramecium" /LENGTH=256 /DNA_ID=CAMNT_0000604271 /DNA_START=479 /DNA_END=1245 /DNA_ORIENTATION=- /assembly_acc=CAM_ASM_000170